MADIIAEAHSKRFTIQEEDPKRQSILITDQWLEELKKFPYHSSKTLSLISLEKPGTGIFLIKEHSKLYKGRTDKKEHQLSKRLSLPLDKDEEFKSGGPAVEKKKNLGDGKSQVIIQNQQTPSKPSQHKA